MSIFRKAERKKAKLRLALDGCSGSGKTYSALLIAKGLGGKVALADTEHGSGDLYADLIDYDIVTFGPPYSPERYIKIIQEAEAAGYKILIFDSLSHEWNGEGGILEIHDIAKKTSPNSFTAWSKVTPRHDALINAILQSNLHIICTLRTKTAYDLSEKDGKGKTKVQKVGTAPVQREGLDYEFTVVFDLIPDGHIATCSKDRTGLFDNTEFVPTPKTGKRLLAWLEQETAVPNKGEDFIRETEMHQKIRRYAAKVKKLNPTFGDSWFTTQCGRFGGTAVEEITDMKSLEELLRVIEAKGKELNAAQQGD